MFYSNSESIWLFNWMNSQKNLLVHQFRYYIESSNDGVENSSIYCHFLFDRNAEQVNRYPDSILIAVTKIGGILAFVRMILLLLQLYHYYTF